jgi:predicted ATPase with chaperone activity
MSIDALLNKIESEIKNLKIMVRSKERFLRAAGKWADLDTEKLKKEIYEARTISTRAKVEL